MLPADVKRSMNKGCKDQGREGALIVDSGQRPRLLLAELARVHEFMRTISPDCVFDASLVPETCSDRLVDSKGLINKFLDSDNRKDPLLR